MMFLICTLVVWRITSLLHVEAGPYDMFEKLRKRSRKHTGLMDCELCLSLWVALPFSFLFTRWWLYWFALSAAVIIINAIYERIIE